MHCICTLHHGSFSVFHVAQCSYHLFLVYVASTTLLPHSKPFFRDLCAGCQPCVGKPKMDRVEMISHKYQLIVDGYVNA